MGSPTFGVLHDFRQPLPWRITTAEYHAECLELIEAAERLGYEAVWLSEHHGTTDATRRSRKIGTSRRRRSCWPRRSPRVRNGSRSARTCSCCRCITRSGSPRTAPRCMRCPAGGSFWASGRGTRRTSSSCSAWNGRTGHRVSRKGSRPSARLGRTAGPDLAVNVVLPDGPFEPRPDGPAPIYVGATGGPALDRAVRLADGLLTYVAEPRHAAARYAAYAEALGRAGRPRETFPFVLTGVCHVAADAGEAWKLAAPGIAYLESGLRPEPLRPEDLDPAEYLVGTPDDVAKRLTALYAEVPFDHFAFWARLPGVSVAAAAESQRLFATTVVPALR